MRKKKKKTLQQWLIPKLRRISMHWPEMNEALKLAKVKVPIGTNKNGTVKYKVKIRCSCCEELFDGRPNVEIDHIDPVVNITGFIDWNSYINTLFCSVENLRVLCKDCHDDVTYYQEQLREDFKNNS